MTRIEALQERCIGAGNCVDVAEKYFDLGDDGLVVALHETVEDGDESLVRRAVGICPATAILLHDAGS